MTVCSQMVCEEYHSNLLQQIIDSTEPAVLKTIVVSKALRKLALCVIDFDVSMYEEH